MDDRKRKLKGSESRDTFKQLHKELNRRFYASDLDLVLVEKNPPGQVACIDFKLPYDHVSFAEVLTYNDQLKIAPVFIIESPDPLAGPFRVLQYLGGDWHPEPPSVKLELVCVCEDWAEFGVWENALRLAYAWCYLALPGRGWEKD